MKRSLSILIFIFFSQNLFAQKNISLTSPDGRITFHLTITKGVPTYSISFDKNILIENSSLNVDIEGMGRLRQASIGLPIYKEVNEQYKLIVGKTSLANNHYR